MSSPTTSHQRTFGALVAPLGAVAASVAGIATTSAAAVYTDDRVVDGDDNIPDDPIGVPEPTIEPTTTTTVPFVRPPIVEVVVRTCASPEEGAPLDESHFPCTSPHGATEKPKSDPGA